MGQGSELIPLSSSSAFPPRGGPAPAPRMVAPWGTRRAPCKRALTPAACQRWASASTGDRARGDAPCRLEVGPCARRALGGVVRPWPSNGRRGGQRGARAGPASGPFASSSPGRRRRARLEARVCKGRRTCVQLGWGRNSGWPPGPGWRIPFRPSCLHAPTMLRLCSVRRRRPAAPSGSRPRSRSALGYARARPLGGAWGDKSRPTDAHACAYRSVTYQHHPTHPPLSIGKRNEFESLRGGG